VEQNERPYLSATRVLSETPFCIPRALLAASSFISPSPSVQTELSNIIIICDHTTMCGKSKQGWFDVGVRADAIAHCGAQEALVCVTEPWGPCRTSHNAPFGCPQSRGCPTGDASETPSGRSRVSLLVPEILKKGDEELISYRWHCNSEYSEMELNVEYYNWILVSLQNWTASA